MIASNGKILAKNGKIISTYAPNYMDVIDTQFNNSLTYSAGIRSAASSFDFIYTGNQIKIKGNPTYYGTYPQFSHIVIIVNYAVYQVVNITNTNEITVNLPGGVQHIRIVEGLTTNPSGTILGTWLTYLYLDANKFIKIYKTTFDKRIVFAGDSIMVGANADYPSVNGFGALCRIENDFDIVITGYGYGRLKDIAETAGKISTFTGYLSTLFTNVTTKKLFIEYGTNDFALDSTAANTFETWYGNLLDAVHTLDSSITIYCLSPLIRAVDGALLDSYRTSIANLCAARSSYCIHIAGKTLLTTGDLADGVHPSTAGHLKLRNAIFNTIYP